MEGISYFVSPPPLSLLSSTNAKILVLKSLNLLLSGTVDIDRIQTRLYVWNKKPWSRPPLHHHICSPTGSHKPHSQLTALNIRIVGCCTVSHHHSRRRRPGLPKTRPHTIAREITTRNFDRLASHHQIIAERAVGDFAPHGVFEERSFETAIPRYRDRACVRL